MRIKCLPVRVYRSSTLGDCTNHGVSSRHDELLVWCPDGHRVIDSDTAPDNLMVVQAKSVFGRLYYHLEPAEFRDGKVLPKSGKWYMDGGNFAYSSDSRFNDMVGRTYAPVAIHDRVESKEEYDMLSR